MRQPILAALILLHTLFCALGDWRSAYAEPNAPDSRHCGQSGPVTLPIDYCGCTWGSVYYRGKPVIGAPVTLSLNGRQAITTTAYHGSIDTNPFYGIEGYVQVDARLNDIITLTTTFAGQTIQRSVRAIPDPSDQQDQLEQKVALVLPETNQWHPWITGGYTRTLVAQGQQLWAGGTDGILSVNTTTGISTTHNFTWSSPSVVAIGVAANGHVWVAGSKNLAEFDGATWQQHDSPFAANVNISALVVHPQTGALWVGATTSSNSLAVYTGTWQLLGNVPEVVTALTIDKEGDLWVGTAGRGLYRLPHDAPNFSSGWKQLQENDGLASKHVLSLAVGNDHLWIGTKPYNGDTTEPRGGISRYGLLDGSWLNYTTAQGLASSEDEIAPPIYTLAVDSNQKVWAGTNDGIYLLATPEQWVNDAPRDATPVRALGEIGGSLVAARGAGLERLMPISAVLSPTVKIDAHPTTVPLTDTISISATATISQSNGAILAWEWVSDQIGPICTTEKNCKIAAAMLQEGSHQITVRVQDDKGVWSNPETITVVVVENPIVVPQSIFLPLITR